MCRVVFVSPLFCLLCRHKNHQINISSLVESWASSPAEEEEEEEEDSNKDMKVWAHKDRMFVSGISGVSLCVA